MHYLPKISSGEWMACYNLTEPDAGSDANSGKTKAVLSKMVNIMKLQGKKFGFLMQVSLMFLLFLQELKMIKILLVLYLKKIKFKV